MIIVIEIREMPTLPFELVQKAEFISVDGEVMKARYPVGKNDDQERG